MVYTAARAQQKNNSTFVANVHGAPISVPIIVAEAQEFTMKTLLAATNRLNNLAPEQALTEIYRYNNLAPEQKLAEVY